jgi:hypothetical protein
MLAETFFCFSKPLEATLLMEASRLSAPRLTSLLSCRTDQDAASVDGLSRRSRPR